VQAVNRWKKESSYIWERQLQTETAGSRICYGNVCHQSFKDLSSGLLCEIIMIKVQRNIMPLVFNGCKTWSVTFRQELRLRVFENRVPRKIFGPKTEESTGEWGK